MFKKEFAQKLRELQKRSGVRQKDIADKLGLSDASVSQFMHGVSLPRMEQFRVMLDLMQIPESEAGKLNFQLMMARAGSQMSEPEKAVVEANPFIPGEEPANDPPRRNNLLWDRRNLDYFVNEDTTLMIQGIPVIALSDLDMFDGSIPLETYARNRTDEIMRYRATDLAGTVLILAEGTSLSLPHCGMLRLSAIDERHGGSSTLDLCCFRDESFHIIPNKNSAGGNWESFFPVPQFDEKDIQWRIPLLEVGITPVYNINVHKLTQGRKHK